MTEFRSFVFKDNPSKKSFPFWIIYLVLLSLGGLLYLFYSLNTWSVLFFFGVPAALTLYQRFSSVSLSGKNEELNGYYAGEIRFNEEKIVIFDKSFSIKDIMSISIFYRSVYGEDNFDPYSGHHKKNGVDNVIEIKMKNGEKILTKFHLASYRQAEELYQISDSLKTRVQIINYWKIDSKKTP
jgi:hypothetical protein